MHNEFTAIIEQDGDWFIAYSPEVPGANGQGHTIDEAQKSFADAISLILEDRREDACAAFPTMLSARLLSLNGPLSVAQGLAPSRGAFRAT